jgi:hypothetical protein
VRMSPVAVDEEHGTVGIAPPDEAVQPERPGPHAA